MDKNVKERFDNASKEYVTDRYIWRYRAGQLVSKLVNPNLNDIILDMGCGTGKQIVELSNAIKLGIGIDISEGMIKQSIENASNENRKNVEFFIGTFDEPDGNVDLKKKQITKIISNYALHHLNLHEKKNAIEKMVYIGGQSLQTIVIGDLMFFENPDKYEDEYDTIGYGPGGDQPSMVEELIKCFSELDYSIEVHRLHALVGVLVANKR
ncbi:class I SAM-dependent methyltransferase [Pelosinus sp. IPA-1]|uniref:class I SAM-dependent methyltransferase n=1 Tax=Pelosinus sp. IPA-1 TaxID=3029569 RepID=UPI0024361AD8|nr:class I SAM-dependent methyltransferase [Pelosinus sp. IPA-1]GMA98216.1 S-adenosylmethionine-dependent methyltransferase [Pelosinus sp. IPA-1]